jgi:hypothetical protein
MNIVLIKNIQRKVLFNLFIKELNKFKSLDFENEVKKPFLKFIRFINSKNVVNICKNLILRLKRIDSSIDITAKKFLTAYMVVYYTDDIINKGNRHFTDNMIINWSKKLLKYDINNIITTIKNYSIFCNKWLEVDKNRQIEQMIISYNNGMKYIKVMKERKEENKVKRTELEMKMILKNLSMMDKNFDIKYFEKNYEKVFNSLQKGYTNMINAISNNIYKAYYNKMVEDLYNKEIKYVYKNMIELKDRFIKVVPKKFKTSISNKLNNYDIASILLLFDWSKEIKDIFLLMMDSIVMFGSINEEKKNIEWKNKMILLMKTEFSEALPSIILMINQKLDKLENDIKKFS